MRDPAFRFILTALFGCLVFFSAQAADTWRNIAPSLSVTDPLNLYNLRGFDSTAQNRRVGRNGPYVAPDTTSDYRRVGNYGGDYATAVYFDVSRLPTNVASVKLWYYRVPDSGTGAGLCMHVPMALLNTGMNYFDLTSVSDYANCSTDNSLSFAPTQGGWAEMDITSVYQSWKSSTGWDNNGLILRANMSGGAGLFYSSTYSGTTPDQFLPRLQVTTAGPEPFLSFPLSADYPQGAYTPLMVTSVLDHKMSAGYSLYDFDGEIAAYTGEYGSSTPGYPRVAQACYPVQFPVSGAQNVDVEGLYKGTTGCTRSTAMNYDGHPGYDYVATEGTPVRSATPGFIKKCVMTSRKDTAPEAEKSCDAWGMLSVEYVLPNGDKYRLQYEHLSSYVDNLTGAQLIGAPVDAGQLIGYSGHKSIYDDTPKQLPDHFHFEVLKWDPNGAPMSCPQDQSHCVDGGIKDPDCDPLQDPNQCTVGSWKLVDPYGWNGKGNDPLKDVTGIPNWRLWQ